MKVRDIEAKHISGFGNLFERKDFKENIELPCLEACLYLYDLNIRTMATNCNKENPEVYLYFEFESLSDENKEIARNLAKNGILFLDEKDLIHLNCGIKFDASLDSDVATIKNKLLEIVSNFKYQDVLSNRFKKSKLEFFKYCIKSTDYYNLFVFDDEGELWLQPGIEYTEDIQLKADEFIKYLENEYQKVKDMGLVDLETGFVYENLELAKKHQDYLESIKGKKM